MDAPRSGREAGIESELLDLGEVPLSKLRNLDGDELRNALSHAADRAAFIPVTASGSGAGGAERVD
ncbi:hypothetical protein [Amycolatopsis sp. Hca4]|uniref:hypothetical protein n=1 Tax=Amycolatopsis sp. Hca4 TaxID=2742131 RepID=UPI0015906DCF|nr:hypothetical protein [Amycolatopsis sp. Hca4]QKV78424.1 hypothetical protein HUT10_35075 [Amycolatopsis sp. Hca4]